MAMEAKAMRIRGFCLWVSLVAVLVGFAPGVRAEEGGEEERKNELAAVLAGTHEDEDTFFTLGVEYKRELSGLVALTAVGEMVLEGGSREAVIVFPVILQPWRGLHLIAGPGFEHSGEEGSSFLFRVGAGWGFEVGERYAITPAVELDFVDGEDGVERVVVFGLSLGFAF